MANYVFNVEEVNRNGFIAFDAIEGTSKDRIELNTPMKAGEYPDIQSYLLQPPHNLQLDLTYTPSLGDQFNQAALQWTFTRGSDIVVVNDIVRTVLRVMHIQENSSFI